MKTPRVYIDTSVLGGCFDREFQVWSNALMEDFRARRFVPLLSDLLDAELRGAPRRVQDLFAELVSLGAEMIPGDEARQLVAGCQARSVSSSDTRHWQSTRPRR